MPESSALYKLARLHYRSGQHRDLCLTQTEILNLAAAIHNQDNGIHHTTLYYDESAEVGKQLSHVISLKDIEHFEVDDTYYTLRELEIRGFKDLRLCSEPGWFKSIIYKFKWWLEDKKEVK